MRKHKCHGKEVFSEHVGFLRSMGRIQPDLFGTIIPFSLCESRPTKLLTVVGL